MAPLQSCLSAGVQGSLGKEKEALPGADPAPCACCSFSAQPCLPPSLPVPLHPQKHPQEPSPVVQAPALQTPLPSMQQQAAREGLLGFYKYSSFHIGFPLPGAALLRQQQHFSNCRKSS